MKLHWIYFFFCFNVFLVLEVCIYLYLLILTGFSSVKSYVSFCVSFWMCRRNRSGQRTLKFAWFFLEQNCIFRIVWVLYVQRIDFSRRYWKYHLFENSVAKCKIFATCGVTWCVCRILYKCPLCAVRRVKPMVFRGNFCNVNIILF